MANPLYGQNKADTAIDNVSTLQVNGMGIHEYYEVVDISTADDNDVAASLSIFIPAGAIILDAGLVVHRLSSSAHGDVALEVHSAAVADDAASGGTEIVGADVASNVSSPLIRVATVAPAAKPDKDVVRCKPEVSCSSLAALP